LGAEATEDLQVTVKPGKGMSETWVSNNGRRGRDGGEKEKIATHPT